jgi:hypothetical protein
MEVKQQWLAGPSEAKESQKQVINTYQDELLPRSHQLFCLLSFVSVGAYLMSFLLTSLIMSVFSTCISVTHYLCLSLHYHYNVVVEILSEIS